MNTEQPPHSIAAIIAEIRGARNAASDITLVPTDWLTQWADRIEAAAEREARAREQAAADYAIKRGEDIHADRCRNCTERATGNVAATREALDFVSHMDDNGYTSYDVATAIEKARAALSEPARNCDISRTKREAKMEYDSRHDAEYGSKDDFVDWLFRPAEGGKE